MLKYVVKSVSKATDINTHKQRVITSYHGKNQKLLASDSEYINQKLTPYYVQEYGYDRECDAKKSWCYRNPQNDEHWKTEVEVVKVLIQEGINESWCVELV